MPFIYVPSGIVPADIFDYEVYRSSVALSAMEFLRWSLGTRNQLAEHFEAATLADLMIPYGEAIVGGSSSALFVDNDPSVLTLLTGGAIGDSIEFYSERTASLLGLGGQTLKFEAHLRISGEATIMFRFGIRNPTTNIDELLCYLDTAGGAPVDDGVLRTQVDGAGINSVDANLVSGEDLTLMHTYRLEMEPGVEARLYVDGTLRATQATGALVPEDQTFEAYFMLLTRANAVREMQVDYYKLWSE